MVDPLVDKEECKAGTDFAHPSRADGGEDFVWAEFGAGYKCHFFSKAIQFRITVKGAGADAAVSVGNRNWLPSAVTSH